MNPALISLALYLRDLLSHDENLIKFGRDNKELDLTSKNYIVIDESNQSYSGSEISFDGDAEEETYSKQTKSSVTVNFYGTDAYANLNKFKLLQRSQKSYELQRDLGIAVFNISASNDLKFLGGSIYSNRYEIDLTIQYQETTDVETLRIDTAQTTFIFD